MHLERSQKGSQNQPDATPIRAIFFDAAGTLFRLRKSVGHGYSEVARRHGIDLDPTTTDAAFWQAWSTMPPMGSSLAPHDDRSEKTWWHAIVDRTLEISTGG